MAGAGMVAAACTTRECKVTSTDVSAQHVQQRWRDGRGRGGRGAAPAITPLLPPMSRADAATSSARALDVLEDSTRTALVRMLWDPASILTQYAVFLQRVRLPDCTPGHPRWRYGRGMHTTAAWLQSWMRVALAREPRGTERQQAGEQLKVLVNILLASQRGVSADLYTRRWAVARRLRRAGLRSSTALAQHGGGAASRRGRGRGQRGGQSGDKRRHAAGAMHACAAGRLFSRRARFTLAARREPVQHLAALCGNERAVTMCLDECVAPPPRCAAARSHRRCSAAFIGRAAPRRRGTATVRPPPLQHARAGVPVRSRRGGAAGFTAMHVAAGCFDVSPHAQRNIMAALIGALSSLLAPLCPPADRCALDSWRRAHQRTQPARVDAAARGGQVRAGRGGAGAPAARSGARWRSRTRPCVLPTALRVQEPNAVALSGEGEGCEWTPLHLAAWAGHTAVVRGCARGCVCAATLTTPAASDAQAEVLLSHTLPADPTMRAADGRIPAVRPCVTAAGGRVVLADAALPARCRSVRRWRAWRQCWRTACGAAATWAHGSVAPAPACLTWSLARVTATDPLR